MSKKIFNKTKENSIRRQYSDYCDDQYDDNNDYGDVFDDSNNYETTKKASARKKSSRKYRWNKKQTFKVLLGAFVLMVLAVVIYAGITIIRAPKIDTNNIYNILSESTTIYDDNNQKIDNVYTDANRDNVNAKDIPEDLKHAFIALEDKSFEKHHGFNFIRIFGAIKDAVFSGGQISGTSTITQQLARNLFIPEDRFTRSMKRKIVEAYYAVILEKELTKDEILEAYLNTIFFGFNSYGVQTASQSYFSKDIKDLTIAECAALASLPQAPTEYQLVEYIEGGNPKQYKDVLLKETTEGIYIANDVSKSRREICLDLMKEQGYINEKEYKEAINTKLVDMLNPNYSALSNKSSYFADYVIESVINDLVEEKGWEYDKAWEAVYEGGLHIHSTLDAKAQEVAENELANPAIYPSISYATDSEGNLLNNKGQLVLYSYNNFFNDDAEFVFKSDEIKKKDDGSYVVTAGKRLNIYETKVNGNTDYSLEFKPLYVKEDGILYGIEGGFINIPAEYKSRNKNGDLVIDSSFMKDYKDFFLIDEDGTVRIPAKSYTLKNKVIQPQAAMTIVENETGYIKAMVGGRNTTGRKLFNRATNPRQPGSSIKPLGVYAPALQQSAEEHADGKKHSFVDYGIDEQGADLYGDYLTAGSIVIDEPTTIDGKRWPRNYGGSFSGPQTLRSAMAQSLNTCAVKVLLQVGEQYSADTIKKFGITTLVEENGADINPAALALGGMTHGVTTLEMASAYTAFPNNGVKKDPICYTKVVDREGNIILEKKNKSHKVLDPGVAWIMTNMLRSVIGTTAPGAAISGVPTAGKTGTTDNEFDLWFDGFTPTYSGALWIGCDYNLEIEGSSSLNARIWGNIMSQIPRACAKGSFRGAPGNVSHVGGEYFISGTDGGRTDIDKLSESVVICTESGMLATPSCTHTEEKKFSKYGDKEKKAPEHYCHLHNGDVSKYPIKPGETLAPQPEPDKKPDEGEDDDSSGDNPDTGANPQPPATTQPPTAPPAQ